ncbi:MAG TPA: cyclopropane-fatty-acyl-phospholipid synthase family protein [Vicinamibacterales bacterium]|nr:cyclopropane-fatty-acyl-phospholipid synthase family protein [Vicinamibacterales bacterium]
MRQVRPIDRWLGRHLQATLAPVGIQVRLWDHSSPWSGDSPVGELLVQDRLALLGLILTPDWSFGEMYMQGRVLVHGDLPRVVEALNRLARPSPPSALERLQLALAPANDLLRARRNIYHHYDIGNDFYRLWLDEGLVYTCACYPTPDATLEEAQHAKLEMVCRKLALQPGEEVVEAGCGWGALALHMAKHYGVRVRAYNISRDQIAHARQRAADQGLSSRVEFVEADYRSISGQFDAFVSVGMLEHVGRKQLDALAHIIRRSLKPGSGRGLLHFIGRDHPRPLNAWIRRRIFPGAYPPTLPEVIEGVLQPANLSVLDVENLRLHYARTLTDWRTRFERAESAVRNHFGEPFVRAWHLYLTGSEAAFTTGWLQLFQIVFAEAGGTTVHRLRPSHPCAPAMY